MRSKAICNDIIELELPDGSWLVNRYEERIIRDPQICGGDPVFKGTRVTLRTVLASLAAGDSTERILADFPALGSEDIQAAISFAATSAAEDLPVSSTPTLLICRDEDQARRESSSLTGICSCCSWA